MREVNGFFCRLLLLLRRDGYRNCKCPKQRSIVETSGEMLNRHIASYALIRSSEKRDQELSSPDKIFDRRLARQLSETHMRSRRSYKPEAPTLSGAFGLSGTGSCCTAGYGAQA